MLLSIVTWLLSIGPALAAQQINGGGEPATAAPTAAGAAASPAAQQATDACGQGGGGMFSMVWIFALIAVFYFMLIRPQSKRAKEHQSFTTSLKKGDNIILNSGIYGTIVGMAENVATIEIADKVRVRVAKSQIAGFAKNADKALEQSERK